MGRSCGDLQQVAVSDYRQVYLGPHDLASHSSKGMTERNRVMFGPSGHAYVYMICGMHFCLNVVTESEGHGSAVLLRALEPVRGIVGRTQGPALLCRALGIDRHLNGYDLVSVGLYLAVRNEDARPVVARGARTGTSMPGTIGGRVPPGRYRPRPHPFATAMGAASPRGFASPEIATISILTQ